MEFFRKRLLPGVTSRMMGRWFLAFAGLIAGSELRIVLAAPGVIESKVDWPHVRGPRYDGWFDPVELMKWRPTNGLAVIWNIGIGQGFSGCVAVGERVYTQAQDSAGQAIWCFSLKSGELLWRSNYGLPWELDGRYPGPFGTPTIADGQVYFSDCYGVIGCARESDGTIRWKFDAVKRVNPGGVDFGYAATPLVLGSRVYVPAPAGDTNATLICLDATTGSLLWQSGTSRASYASCTPIQVGGRDCLLLPLRNGVGVYDRQNGKELWKAELSKGYDEHSSWPLFREPFLFVASPFRRGSRVYRLSGTPGREELQGELVWQERLLSNDVFPSVLVGGCVYGFDVLSQQSEFFGRTRGALKCIDFATGQMLWSNEAIKHCSLSMVGDDALLLEDDGGLAFVKLLPDGYQEHWRTRLPRSGVYWTAPLVLGDRLLVRNQSGLTCYSLGTGDSSSLPMADSSANSSRGQELYVLRTWLDQYRSPAFTAPSDRDYSRWFWDGIVVLFSSALISSLITPSSRRLDWLLFANASLGGIACYGLSELNGRFAFTIPVSLCAVFCAVIFEGSRLRGRAQVQRVYWIRARLALVAFLVVCLIYYGLCVKLFFVAGWGFLTGFTVTLPMVLWIRNRKVAAMNSGRVSTAMWSVAVFTVYYWSSVLLTRWLPNW